MRLVSRRAGQDTQAGGGRVGPGLKEAVTRSPTVRTLEAASLKGHSRGRKAAVQHPPMVH